ncbi:ROK family transcriptional regulator [Streptomyces sp. NBC_01498]|uniref:ROK family transcriptional regulator n=1 Tax=Streptomyces sp. NBC_01498 TaxID=2975870 RepID=UPI002E7BAEE9|nr:ROK family transcriptional regulator [Streptomyces sp. NBC_01498]WTL28338.1 ROK family transcriptional regulator [Streptomyces sp. NBC_01498]
MPAPPDRSGHAVSHTPGEVLTLISSGAAATRADLARMTGLARSTVAQRVDALIAHGFVDESGPESGDSTGGRPPRRLRLRTREHAVAGVDLGASHCRVALMDIGGTTLATREDPLSIGDGPDPVLRHVEHTLRALLEEAGRDPRTLRSIGVGVPGPVEFSTGRPVDPPIMPGWHQYPIPEFFASRFGARALVDNDVNVMALAEQRRAFPETRFLLHIKVGTGIGCGIVADGRLHRGAQGSAGDIGHIKVGEREDACRCGNFGCLEAVAGGAAIAGRLAALGLDAVSGRDVVRLVTSGNRDALRMVREAGRAVGEVLAGLVNFFNPDTVVLGGALAAVHDQLLAGVREAVYRRSNPLATRVLRIEPSRTGENAAALGAGILAIEHALSPAQVDRRLAGGIPA